jgi:alkanesulfonate monooxygenase SsuD/methylene tetrahydromethanopterin reductase-like flavin-dependent oxidoreductase (luciferase family)
VTLRFGLLWSFRNPDWNRVPWNELYRSHLDLVVESERLGFDDAWLTEHHFVDDGYSPSLFPIAAAIASRTESIRIGTFLLLLPLHNPVRVAEDTVAVDLLSDGRFDLGVGLGYRVGEFDPQGVPAAQRAKRMREALPIVQQLLSGQSVTFDGAYNQLDDIRITPPAIQQPHPPMWVGGVAPAAIDRAARMGFHFLAGSVATANAYDAALVDHGRDPAELHIAGNRPVYVAPTREQAWALAAEPLHHMATNYLRWTNEAKGLPDPEEQGSLPTVEEIIAAQAMDVFGEPALVGTPEDVIGPIEDYCTRGRITHFVCMTPLPGMAPEHIHAGMELFAREVIPHFRST